MRGESAKRKLGRRIAAYRRRSGLKQQALGDAIGRGYRSVSDYERGVTTVPVEILISIARAFRIPLGDLVGPAAGFEESSARYDAGSPENERHAMIFDRLRRAVDEAEQASRPR